MRSKVFLDLTDNFYCVLLKWQSSSKKNRKMVYTEIQSNSIMASIFKVPSDEAGLVELMAYSLVVMVFPLALILKYRSANYGRYSSTAWRFRVNSRLAWFIQELPAFSIMAYYYFLSQGEMVNGKTNNILMVLFLIHYFQRTFIFTYLIRGGKPTPIHLCVTALIFCACNAYIQGCHLAKFASYPDNWCTSLRFIVGMGLFLSGMAINIHSDHLLRNLRKPGETGYKIPRGGMFEYVSGANYFGEIVEWSGFALAAWSLPSLAFAMFTMLTIGPRALSHHQWYLNKFGSEYPQNRKALIPFVF